MSRRYVHIYNDAVLMLFDARDRLDTATKVKEK